MVPLHLVLSLWQGDYKGFRSPQDLSRLKRLTTGVNAPTAIIMGRNTWESLPVGVRNTPDPWRNFFVVGSGYHSSLVEVLNNLEQGSWESVWIWGGMRLWEEALAIG